jgi:glycosyltransferase involved in cell wall biosynthesis
MTAVSVVIACRNAADTLPVQLSALASQHLDRPWEVVLCDNGSTDRSLEVATAFAAQLPLRIVDAGGCVGAGQVRNLGVTQSRGRAVVFCDADDEVAPGWLQAMVHALDHHPVVAGRFEGTKLNDAAVLRSRGVPQSAGLQTADYGACLPHAGAGSLGVDRTLFSALGGFDPQVRWLQDTDFCWRVQLSGIALHFEPAAVVHVRLRPHVAGSFRQAVQYGRAHAVLEQRYGAGASADVDDADTSAPPQQRLSWRRAVWRLGWSVGHRVQLADPTLPVLAGPPVTVPPSESP